MPIELSDSAAGIMLNSLSAALDGGSVEIMSDDKVLAVLRISDAATYADREIELTILEEDAALATGIATSARVDGATGWEIFRCDVGDEQSDAVIKLNTTKIFRGGPVRLTSFRLRMP